MGRQAGHQKHQGQGVQNAEINEALRKHDPRGQCDKQRAAQHLQPAPPKTRPALPLRLRQRLPQAGAQHKQAHDQAALPGPERITVKILPDVAKLIEVKAKVESRHPDHGETPQGVNSMDAASWLGQCLWVHANTIPDRRRWTGLRHTRRSRGPIRRSPRFFDLAEGAGAEMVIPVATAKFDHTKSASTPFASTICNSLAAVPLGLLFAEGDSHF